MSRSVMIPGPAPLGVDHDRRADLALGHQPRDGAQRVTRPHREDRRAHSLANLHLSDSFPAHTSDKTPPHHLQRLPQCSTASAPVKAPAGRVGRDRPTSHRREALGSRLVMEGIAVNSFIVARAAREQARCPRGTAHA